MSIFDIDISYKHLKVSLITGINERIAIFFLILRKVNSKWGSSGSISLALNQEKLLDIPFTSVKFCMELIENFL